MTTDQSTPSQDDHPMENIEVRRLRFRFKDYRPEQVVWSQSSPLFAIFANAFNLHVPYFERYLVQTMMAVKPQIKDEKLLKDVDALIGQEAQHANSFVSFNKLLAHRYPRAEALEAEAKDEFSHRMKTESTRDKVGFTAGYETFTFLAGMLFLENYDKWFADSDPAVKAMWVWHQVEEVEHAAVAFDVLKYLYAGEETFRRWMIVKGLWHIVRETSKAYWHMCRVEGYFSTPFKAFQAVGFISKLFAQMMWNVRPVFRKSYHPSRHPVATTKQNPVATSWRRFHRAGGDVLEIDRQKMAMIMNIAHDDIVSESDQ